MMCKVCVIELLSPKQLELLKFVRKGDIYALIHNATKCFLSGEAVNMSKMALTMTTYIILRTASDNKYCEYELENRGFKDMIKEVFFLSGPINIGDFIPWLESMDLQGLGNQQKIFHKTFDDFFDMIIKEYT